MNAMIQVEIEGQVLTVSRFTRVADLLREMGLHPESTLVLVNGRPAPERMYLSQGDRVKFVKVTVHFQGV
ncbi:MAG TPA: MoaD/ThiS family protein [Candidatus Korarchaeota archaeon]|nr:MoaD/ThiS family protein [Candidatus Korarchaeota archaeon]